MIFLIYKIGKIDLIYKIDMMIILIYGIDWMMDGLK